MPITAAINTDGSVQTTLQPIYEVDNTNIHTIKNLKFNNTDTGTGYVLSVYKLIGGEDNPILLYSLTLDAGDSVDDNTGYDLQSGVSLQAIADVDTVVFSITGYEQAAQ